MTTASSGDSGAALTPDDDQLDQLRWPAAVVTPFQLIIFTWIVSAIVLRFVGLGQPPLSPIEATNAYAVWVFWQPSVVDLADELHSVAAIREVESSAYFSLTALLSQIAGYSDANMRLVSALAGVMLIFVPIWFRSTLGRFGTLTTIALLTLSPVLVYYSRLAGGQMLSIFALALIFLFFLRYREFGRDVDVYRLAAVVGFGLTTSPLFYGGCLTMAAAWGLERALGPKLVIVDNEPPKRQTWQTIGIIAGIVFFLISTAFLLNGAGIGVSADILANWLADWRISIDLVVLLDPFLVAMRYQPLLLLLALAAMAWATWVADPIGSFLAYWFVVLIIYLFVQAGEVSNVALLVFVGSLLIGRMVAVVVSKTRWHWYDEHQQFAPTLAMPLIVLWLILATISAANLGRFARISMFDPSDLSHFALVVICVIVALAMWLLVFWVERQSAIAGGLIAILVFVGVWQWSVAWRIGYTAVNDPRERLVVEAADDEVPIFTDTIREVGRQLTGSDASLALFSAVDHPILRWYLRDYPLASFGETVPVGSSYDVVITPIDMEDPPFGTDYLGTDFGLSRSDIDHNLSSLDLLRWWLFYQSPQPIPETRVALWVRTDLLTNQ